METMKISHVYLEELRSKGKAFVKGASSLNGVFDKEEARLKRADEVSILTAVRRAIVGQLQELKHSETLASYSHSQANFILSLGGLAVTAVVSKNNRLSAMRDYLLREPTDRQRPFGLVMVCIGPKGLPDDVKAVSISQVARESNRLESQIINKLREDGYLLFSQEAFSALIDKLTGVVREGQLSLTISRDKLAEIAGLNKPKPRIRIIESE